MDNAAAVEADLRPTAFPMQTLLDSSTDCPLILSMCGAVDIDVIRNTIYEVRWRGNPGGSYILRDKFFLAVHDRARTRQQQYRRRQRPRLLCQRNAGLTGSGRNRLPRRPGIGGFGPRAPSIAGNVRVVHPDGALTHYSANNGTGAAPACVIRPTHPHQDGRPERR